MLRNLFILSFLLASVTVADTASYAPAGYSLIFSDDFTGSSLDNSKWSKYDYASWNVADWRKYNSKDDALYGHTGSKLVLEAKHGNYTSQNNYKNSGYSEAGKTDTTAGYACGAVNSSGKFSFQYGYVEVKARHDCANGVWPAIWMLSSLSGAWPVQGEIDILEHLNFDTHIHQTLHYPDTAGTGHSQKSSYTTGYRGGVHTYGMLWEEGSITMYLDGVQTAKFTPSSTGQYPFDNEGNEFYLILSNQIGGSWVGNNMTPNGVNQTAADGQGTSFEIDYVKVYGSDKSTYTAQTSAEEVTAAESQSFGSGETAIEIAGGDAIVADSTNVIAVGVSEGTPASTNLKMTQDANQKVNVVFSGTETFSGNKDGAVIGVDAALDGTEMKVSDTATKTLRTIKNAEIAKNARTTLDNMTLNAEKVTVNGWLCNNAVVKGDIEVTSAGIMKGRGVFGATILSGKLIVGNSPGLQTFSDTLTLNADSETVFSISTLETDAMATTTTYGWGSGVNSAIDMSGNNLVWNEGAAITLELSLDAFADVGAEYNFELTLFSNVGNGEAFTEEVLAQLAAATTLVFSTEDGAGDASGYQVVYNNISYTVTGNTNGTSSIKISGKAQAAVPEPVSATLSLIGLVGFMMRRRRRCE